MYWPNGFGICSVLSWTDGHDCILSKVSKDLQCSKTGHQSLKCPPKSKNYKLSIQFLKLTISNGVLADTWLFIHPWSSAQFLSSDISDNKCTFCPLNGPKCSIITGHCQNVDQPLEARPGQRWSCCSGHSESLQLDPVVTPGHWTPASWPSDQRQFYEHCIVTRPTSNIIERIPWWRAHAPFCKIGPSLVNLHGMFVRQSERTKWGQLCRILPRWGWL